MIENTQSISNRSWEEFFEQATEDISTYAWAVGSWPVPPQDYNHVYLLILMLSRRARGRRALEAMNRDLPVEYTPYRDRLKSLWSNADELLIGYTPSISKQLRKIPESELTRRINELADALEKVRHLAQDGDISGDFEWVVHDLREIAQDFLLRFQDLFLTKEELKQPPFQITDDYKAFEIKLAGIEKRFQHSFGYFHHVRDFFSALRVREYDCDCWWLNHLPAEDDIREDVMSESILGGLQHAFQSSGAIVEGDCPDPERVIAYARNELEPKMNREVENHLVECRSCLMLVLDVRLAKAEAQEQEGIILHVLPRLWDAIEETENREKSPEPREEEILPPEIIASLMKQEVDLYGMPVTYAPERFAEKENKSSLIHEKLKALYKLEVKPRRGKVPIPFLPPEAKGEIKVLVRFVKGLREYYTAGMAWTADGRRIDLLRKSKSQCSGLRTEEDLDYVYLLICLGPEEKKEEKDSVQQAWGILKKWIESPRKGQGGLQLPYGVVLLFYKVVR